MDRYLGIAAVEDSSNNGLQVEGPQTVFRLAAAVDASLQTIEGAAAVGAQLLLVHHGLYWGKVELAVGRHYRRLKALIQNGIGLYAAHLPLDMHPEVGNNAVLARTFGLAEIAPFGTYRGVTIGVIGQLQPPLPRTAFLQQVAQALGKPALVLPFGPDQLGRIAIISGGGGSMVDQAIGAGADLFLTGEFGHTHYHAALEGRINVVGAGHYATEKVGVMALAQHLAAHFPLEWTFIDAPTGL
jgi:dinuclear metal center YbgI/SA1388 family protein